MSTNRYSLESPALDSILKGQRVMLKHCEACGLLHVTESMEARFPGELLPMQRAAGHRAQIICESCKRKPQLSAGFQAEEVAEMLRIASEIRKDREIKMLQDEERTRFRKPRNILHESKHSERSHRPRAKWLPLLVMAFKEHEYMTAQQIAAVMASAGGGLFKQVQSAVYIARNAGIPIVKSDRRIENGIHSGHGRRFLALFTLSSNPNPEPLTPPQDPETHQFMREVH